MRYKDIQIVLQEIPNEISLAITITGCNIRCDGCHSPDTWKESVGTLLTEATILNTINKYKPMISCVVFKGGEWHEKELINFLCLCRNNGLKTALYTGMDTVSTGIREQLTYLKTGKYISSLGGLNSPTTNQRFIDVVTGKVLNEWFR